MDAGAIGFSGARVLEHLSSTGAHVPGTFAADDELLSLARAMGESGHGTFQIIPLGANGDVMFEQAGAEARLAEHARIHRIAEISGRPVTYLLVQFRSDPDDWKMMLEASARSNAAGLVIRPQVSARGIGTMTMLDGYHIFQLRRAYDAVAHLPLADRVVALRDPARRAAILAQRSDPALIARDPKFGAFIEMLTGRIANIFPMTLPLDYEPGPDQRLEALAAAAGVPMEAYLYDHYTAGDGTHVCASFMLNYAEGGLAPIGEMLRSPLTVGGLGDGGAHMRMMCDASFPTFQLTHWARDRSKGPTIPLAQVVHKLTAANADLYGLADRGRIAPGLRADLNVIDHDRLTLKMPRMAHDLPRGSARLLQGASGYLATIVGGTVTRRNDTDTGARPGRLVRGRAA
jgi:N-acyl-D-aspartate/D-glutamate deacylase